MLAFAGPVDDAAHDRDVHVFDSGVALAPLRHLLAQEALDLFGQLLEIGAGGAAATRASDHHRRERAQTHRLEQLLSDDDLAGPVSAGLGGERDANRVADALLQQDPERGGGSHDAFCSHPRLGEPEVQRIVAAAGKLPVHGDQILDAAHFAREHDAISGQTQAFSARRRFERRGDQRLPRYGVGIDRFCGACVLIHEPRKQLLIEAAPVDADSHGLVVAAGHLDQRRELLVALGTPPDIARVDPVLCQRPRAIGVLGEKLVPVEMEIAHQGHVATHRVQALANARDLRRRLSGVDGDTHDF